MPPEDALLDAFCDFKMWLMGLQSEEPPIVLDLYWHKRLEERQRLVREHLEFKKQDV